MKKHLLFSCFLLLIAIPAQAATEKYNFDPVHTQIIFSVNHLGFSHSHGKFLKFDGGFIFDEQAPETSSVDVNIETTSINMDSEAWETHLKSPDFFNTEKYPFMTFKSVKIKKTGEKTGKLTGDLTLLGITKPVTLDVTFNGSGTHPMNKNHVAGFSASGTVKRSDFGMTFGLPMVGDDVTLDIQVEGIRQDFDKVTK